VRYEIMVLYAVVDRTENHQNAINKASELLRVGHKHVSIRDTETGLVFACI
jgi:hypothetical protein